MATEVDVSPEGMGDISRALTKKRLDCVKLKNLLNEPPRGIADLIAQSRAFTEKLAHLLEDGSELSDSIKHELVDDNGFPGHVRRLPLEDLYSDLPRVKEALRIADGYQPYIVAPEAGLRQLFQNSIGMLINPVRDLVESVHGITTMAADKAMKECCQVPPIDRGSPVIRFPNFIDSLLPVAMEGLEELKREALKTAIEIVEMEQSFVSCSFFRYLTFKRIKEQEEAEKHRRDESSKMRSRRNEEDEENEDDDGTSSIAETEVSLPPVIPGESIPNVYSSPDAVFGLSGYLEKSSTHSRNKFTKLESSLWQRRFFGIRDNTKTLEYYYSLEAFLKGTRPSVVIDLSDCVVSDTDGEGELPQSTLSRSKDRIGEDTQISLLISIRHQDPDKPLYKKSKDLILRAEDAADKYQWLSYLKSTIADSRAGAKVATWSTRAIPKSKSSEVTVASVQERGRFQAVEDYNDIADVGYGLGSSVFWDPICRDPNNALLPSPGIFVDGDADLSMEKALVQHAADMKAYTRLACETLVMTVPKVIVYCLVDRSLMALGPKIQEYLLSLTPEAQEVLLEEDSGIAGHRQRVQQLIDDIGKAQDRLKEAERGMGGNPTVKVDVSIIDFAGLSARLKKGEDGSTVFINKPPNNKRNLTPERKRDSIAPASQSTAQRPQRPAPPSGAQRQPPPPRPNGNASIQPRRSAPPTTGVGSPTPPVAANGTPSVPPNQANKTPVRPPASTSWYGFKPFGQR